MNRELLLIILSIAAVISPRVADGQTLLLDFGTTPATGQVTVDATAAPVLGGPAGLSGSLVYNVLSGTDNNNTSLTFPSSYQYSNGATAAGVSVSFTSGTAWSTMNNGPAAFTRVGFNGARSGVGVFATPSAPNNIALFSDFVAGANAGNANDYLALSIGGLAVGQYDVYAISNNTYLQFTGAQSRQIRAGVGATGITDYSGFAAATTLNYDYTNIATDTATWAAADGKYWTKFTLNISATDTTLYLGGYKLSDNQGGLFNAVQIVAVPEPGTYAMLFCGLLGLFAQRRLRRNTM